MIFALVGNQNSGKTTLFNQLTGANQHVGNFPGVTVDSKMGHIRNVKNCQVVDLPGIYSLRPYTSEEIVTRDFIFNEKPHGIINIIDATNIERNLYLTLQLIEMGLPMVVALNMMDEVRGNGGSVNAQAMSEELGVPVIPISAARNEGIDDLIEMAVNVVENRIRPTRVDFCKHGPVHRCIHAVSHHVEDHAERAGISPRFAGTKLVEDDKLIEARLGLNENELHMIAHSIKEMEDETGMDRNAALAEMRYTFIEEVCSRTVVKSHESKEHRRSVKIDNILTNKYLAIPLFVVIMLCMFWLSFDVIGAALEELMGIGIQWITDLADRLLTSYNINPVVHSLIIDGVFAGVGGVLTFLPIIVTLFFFLSILEDTGYMARVAFVMDRPLRKIGLSGRSLVPMLIGFGCTVPAIMATRTLSSQRDRTMTILLTPYMSCSAKIPIYAVFAAAFFPQHRALAMMGLYLAGILVGVVVALILKVTFRGKPMPFIMELPNYRMPSPKSVLRLMWDKAKDFIDRAFTIIFVATVIIWFLQNFDIRLNTVTDSSQSMLAAIGTFIAPIFKPLGFGDWRIATSLIAGFSAKEAVVSTIGILVNATGDVASALAASGLFTIPSSISFLVFTLLYTPCIAAIAAVKSEMRSGAKAIGIAFLQCAIAWVVSYGVYLLCTLIG